TWYGWDGDRLTTIQNDSTRIQTIYQPGSFTPLISVETATGELAKTQRRSLAEKLQQEGSEDGHGVVFPAELVRLLD
ncbi:RHS repeat protein, partial [Escherichia coli]|uniref:RHS repeat protein n=1 Tax=Escherichia coli TaxID=562 RepID=UPI00112F68E8